MYMKTLITALSVALVLSFMAFLTPPAEAGNTGAGRHHGGSAKVRHFRRNRAHVNRRSRARSRRHLRNKRFHNRQFRRTHIRKNRRFVRHRGSRKRLYRRGRGYRRYRGGRRYGNNTRISIASFASASAVAYGGNTYYNSYYNSDENYYNGGNYYEDGNSVYVEGNNYNSGYYGAPSVTYVYAQDGSYYVGGEQRYVNVRPVVLQNGGHWHYHAAGQRLHKKRRASKKRHAYKKRHASKRRHAYKKRHRHTRTCGHSSKRYSKYGKRRANKKRGSYRSRKHSHRRARAHTRKVNYKKRSRRKKCRCG